MKSFLENKERWNRVAESLETNSGLALVDLPRSDTTTATLACFAQARNVLDHDSNALPEEIPATADSAHVTGYHPADNPWSRRYNRYRQGFVFSNGEKLPCRRLELQPMEDLLHAIAQAVLGGLERRWGIPEGWFESTMGPTKSSSQWHLKRYVEPPSAAAETDDDENAASATDNNKDDLIHLLPTHTDPSLISIVLHHDNNRQGLEYSHRLPDGTKEWRSCPTLHDSTHPQAVILIGSVLAYMTAGQVPACKHRVVCRPEDQSRILGTRMAATLFLRPAGSAVLQIPPATKFAGKQLKRSITFEVWNAKVAKNYQKSKQKQTHENNHPDHDGSSTRV